MNHYLKGMTPNGDDGRLSHDD